MPLGMPAFHPKLNSESMGDNTNCSKQNGYTKNRIMPNHRLLHRFGDFLAIGYRSQVERVRLARVAWLEQ